VSCASRKNEEIEKASYPSNKTYRRCGEDQFVERVVCPRQPVLKGVACRGLLVVLGVIADLEGSRPWGTGELEDMGLTVSNAS
jgi:hypothetical protein